MEDQAAVQGGACGDARAVAATGQKGFFEILRVTPTGMTTEAFAKDVTQWITTARHPRFKRLYTELVYQPMLELLGYVRGNGFQTFIVSRGTIEFMRAWTERVYGIPPEQVVGSSFVTQFEYDGGKPQLMREPKVDFIDDGRGKPVGINRFIGRRPIFAFGNSDGDQQMLEWTAAGAGALHGWGSCTTLMPSANPPTTGNPRSASWTKRSTKANARGWTVVDMKRDWKRVFAFEP